MLTYITSSFETTHRVQTIVSEDTAPTIRFEIMKATELLDEYVKAERVKYHSILAVMVLVSLQKDDKGKNAVAGTVAEYATKLDSLE